MSEIENKYAQIVGCIRDRIRDEIYVSNQRIPSEEALSKDLGVSRATIRRAYGELERQGLLRRSKGSGTFIENAINRKLYANPLEEAAPPTKKIGVVLPGQDEFNHELYEGIAEGIRKRNYAHKLMINTTDVSERETFLEFIREGYDGIVLSPNRQYGDRTFENYKLLENNSMPYVLIGKPPVNVFCNAIYYDDVYGAYSAVKGLFYWGYNSAIVHITNRNCDYESVNERIDGFNYALHRYLNVQNPQQFIFDTSDSAFAYKLITFLQEATNRVGILLYDDLMYSDPVYGNVLGLVQRAGKHVPAQVGIVGYNNLSLCESASPKLTSVEHDKKKIGEKSLELLDLRMARRFSDEIKHTILKPKLIIRESV